MRGIDTNVLVQLITRDDSRQSAAADSFVQRGAWVSVLALAEASWVLTSVYRRSGAQVATAIEMLLRHKDLVLQDADAVASALEVLRAQPALGFSDCLMLELARKFGYLPLGTFERGLSRIAGAEKL